MFILATALFVRNILFIQFNAIGYSMAPTIPYDATGYMYRFEDLDQNLTGKIISYSISPIFVNDQKVEAVVHRVVEDNGWYLVTRGDNCSVNDPWNVEREDVNGIVSYIFPWYVAGFELVLITCGGVVAFTGLKISYNEDFKEEDW